MTRKRMYGAVTTLVLALTALTACSGSDERTSRRATQVKEPAKHDSARIGFREPESEEDHEEREREEAEKEEKEGRQLSEREREMQAPLEVLASRSFPYRDVPAVVVERARARANGLPVTRAKAPTGVARAGDDARQVSRGQQLGTLAATSATSATSSLDATASGTAAAVNPAWSSIGPKPTQQLDGYTDPYGGTPPYAGRIAALAIDPTNSNIAYAGAASGGVWKTTDGGVNWVAKFDGQSSLSIGAIAIDPTNPLVVYAATGEANSAPDAYYGSGVYKSVDGATTWIKLAGSQFDGCHLADIVVQPGTPSTLMLAVQGPPTWALTSPGLAYGADGPTSCVANEGLWRSINSGVSWTRVLTGAPTDITVSVAAPTVWFVGVRQGGVWRSTNSGQNWTQLAGLPTNGGRVVVDVAPTNAQRLYAIIAENPATGLGADVLSAWTSSDGGTSWTSFSVPADFCKIQSPQCDYDLALAVDPTDATVFVAGGVYTYRFTGSGAIASKIGGYKNAPFGPDVIHVDVHSVAFDANHRIWVGSDGGVYRSADNGVRFSNLNATLSITQFNSVDGWLPVGGTQDNGSQFFGGSSVWYQYAAGDGGPAAVNPRNEAEIFGQFQQLTPFKSLDAGYSLTTTTLGIPADTPRLFYSPLAIDSTNPAVLYAGANRLYRSQNSAESWLPYSPEFLGGTGKVTAIGVGANSTVYAASVDRAALKTDLQRTTDGGRSWTSVVNGLPLAFINEIVVDPANANIVYAGLGGFNHGHIYRSVNAGNTWSDVSGNLPDVSVNSLSVDFRTGTPALFAANDVGVFASYDSGATWSRFGTGLPGVIVADLYLDAQSHVLVAGTYGRGVWVAYADGTIVAPGNDSFVNAAPLIGTYGAMYDTSSAATRQTGEPLHGAATGGRSVWYTWTAPTSGPVTFTTSGSGFDTLLGVYTGTSVGALNLIGSNNNVDASHTSSLVAFNATAGTTYRIAVDGVTSAAGFVQLAWLMAPVEDNFAQARTLTGPEGSIVTVNAFATAQSGEPGLTGSAHTKKTTWYQWTAPQSGTLQIDTYNNYSLLSSLSVYTGTSLSALTLKAAKPSTKDLISMAVIAGTTYRLQLDTSSGAVGTFGFVWSLMTGVGTAHAPTITAVDPGDGWASIAWDAPLDVGASPITSYTVKTSTGGVFTVAAPATRAVVSGLTNGQNVTLTVAATNAAGLGVASLGAVTRPAAGNQNVTSYWDPSEVGRLQQTAAYLGVSVGQAQHDTVGAVAFIVGLLPPGATPIAPPADTGISAVTSVWASPEQPFLRSVAAKFALSPGEVQKFSAQLVGFLLAFGGN